MKISKKVLIILLLLLSFMESATAGFSNQNLTVTYSYPDVYSGWPYKDKVIQLGTSYLENGKTANFQYPSQQTGFFISIDDSNINIINATNWNWFFSGGVLKIIEDGATKKVITGVQNDYANSIKIEYTENIVSFKLYNTEFLPNSSKNFKFSFEDSPSPIPEPNSYILLLIGLLIINRKKISIRYLKEI